MEERPKAPDETTGLREQATRGDPRAVEELLVRFLPDLRAFVRLRSERLVRERESCSDVVQSVCREVLERLHEVELRDEASFRNWLFGAVLNKTRDRLRYHFAAMRHPGREVRGDGVPPSSACASLLSPSTAAIGREEVARLEAAFDELPDDYREVITLARVAHLPMREIAAHLGRSEKAARSLLERSLARLAGILASTG